RLDDGFKLDRRRPARLGDDVNQRFGQRRGGGGLWLPENGLARRRGWAIARATEQGRREQGQNEACMVDSCISFPPHMAPIWRPPGPPHAAPPLSPFPGTPGGQRKNQRGRVFIPADPVSRAILGPGALRRSRPRFLK